MSDNAPTLTSWITAAMDGRLKSVRTCLPARVVSYDEPSRTISAQVEVQDVGEDEAGGRVTRTLPVLTEVPVIFPGSGGARIRWELSPGDTVLLIFASSATDLWKIKGGLVDPQDGRHHHHADAVAVPGLQDLAHAGDAPDGAVIEFTGGQIRAGGTSALVTKAEFDAHTHPYTDDGSPSFTSTPTAAITGTQILKAAVVFAVALLLVLLLGGG